MIEVLFVSAAILGGALASYTDLKYGIIPNRLSFSLMVLGLGGYLSYSIYLESLEPLLTVLKNFLIIFVVGYAFWFLGGWSAGDAKELMFLAALVPRYPEFLEAYLTPTLPPYPFSITMLFNTFLAVFPFIAVYAFIITSSRVGIRELAAPLLDYRSYGFRGLILVGGYSLAMFFGQSLLVFPAVLALAMLKDRRMAASLALALAGAYILLGGGEPAPMVRYYLLVSLLLGFLGFFFNALRVLRKTGLRSEVKINKLEEGMILAEDIYEEDGTLVRDSRDIFDKLWDAVKSRGSKEGRKLISPGAAGVTAEDIVLLKKKAAEGKLDESIMITRAMPFAPAIFLGLVLSLLAGDILFILGGML